MERNPALLRLLCHSMDKDGTPHAAAVQPEEEKRFIEAVRHVLHEATITTRGSWPHVLRAVKGKTHQVITARQIDYAKPCRCDVT